eukprot:3863509-Pyramimonas_sp.AAC.1
MFGACGRTTGASPAVVAGGPASRGPKAKADVAAAGERGGRASNRGALSAWVAGGPCERGRSGGSLRRP